MHRLSKYFILFLYLVSLNSMNIIELSESLFHRRLYMCLCLCACISQFLCLILQTILSPKFFSFYPFLLPKSCVICLVFKARTAPFINDAEPGGGTRFRDTRQVFALKLWRVSLPSCSAASEKKSSKLTLQVCRALVVCPAHLCEKDFSKEQRGLLISAAVSSL